MPPLPGAITGGAPFEMDGRRWWLRITHRVLLECEEASGVGMLDGGAAVQSMPAALLRALLWSALRSAGSAWSMAEVGARLGSLRSVASARAAVTEAWIQSMPAAKTKPAEAARLSQAPAKPMTWRSVWASAREEMRLGDEEWLEMTPAQVEALRESRLRQMQREELLVGLVASTVANFGFRAPSRAMRAESFMLHPFEETPAGPVTGEMVMAVLAPIKAELRRKGN